MATIDAVRAVQSSQEGSANGVVFQWPLAVGDDGRPILHQDYADRSVQVVGQFGAGGSVAIEGSNDGTNWSTLRDPNGNSLSFTSPGLAAILELTRYVRPFVNGGDGNTAITVSMLVRIPKP